MPSTVTVHVNAARSTFRIDERMFLGSQYTVAYDGYTVGSPTLILYAHFGIPLAATENGRLSLTTKQLLNAFRLSGNHGCPQTITVHGVVVDGNTVAQADVQVAYSPVYEADGTITAIDTKGEKGDRGEKGDKGDKGDPGRDGAYVEIPGLYGFDVGTVSTHPDAVGHLFVHSFSDKWLYAETNGETDYTKPYWEVDGNGHLLHNIYIDGDLHNVHDLGSVVGPQGDQGPQGEPGEVSQDDLDTALATKADAAHVHDMSDVTGLDTALAGKSDTGHTHTITEVDLLQAALDAKVNSADITTISQLASTATQREIREKLNELITAWNSIGNR